MSTMPDTLTWICDACGDAVDDHAGYLHVNLDAIHATENDIRERRRRRPRIGPPSITDLLESPDDVPWRIHHQKCDPDPRGRDYVYDVAHARTPRQLLERTLHLLDKPWIFITDWTEFVSLNLNRPENAA